MYKPETPITGHTAYAHCGDGPHDIMGMERLLAVGFGDVLVTKDGSCVYSEEQESHNSEIARSEPVFWLGKDAERVAALEPDHDWRVQFIAPLYGATYQRQGTEHWVLVAKDEGFA